jgi:hypothetical protein
MTIATGNFPELLWPGIHDLWGIAYKDWDKLYTKIYEVKKSDKAFEKEQGLTGLGLAMVKDQQAPITYADPFQGYQKEYVNVTFALGTTITREMNEDDQYSYINKVPKMLARSENQTRETIGFNVLNRAQTSGYNGADGVTLLSALHPLVGGGTFRNKLATDADLSQTSLETAIQDIDDFVDDQSLKIAVKAKTLVVPTALRFTAMKLLQTAGVTGSNDNDMNPLKGQGLTLVVSPYLTDPDSWFLVTDVDNGLVWYDRRPAEIVRDNEFDTQSLKVATTSRFVCGFTDPRGVYGCMGA